MAEQVRIDLIAQDKASKPIAQVAEQVDKLENAKPKIEVDADTKPAQKDVGDLLAKVDRLAKDPANLLLTTNATAIASQIADLTIDLDKLDANDPEVAVKAEQINSLQGDLDQVEQKLRDINDTPVAPDTAPAKQGLEEVGKSADSSKSVLANMVGNATQDLGALGGIAGSAGVAIGQMGEYMVDARNDGDKLTDVLSNFAAVAGPIALITVAVSVLTGVLEDQKKAAEASAARVKEFADAFKGAVPPAQALAQHFAETTDEMRKFNAEGEGFAGGVVDGLSTVAKHLPIVGGMIGDAGQNITNLNKLLDKGGLSLYQFSQSVADGGRVGDDFSKSLLAAGDAGKLTTQEVSFLIQAVGTYGQEAAQAKQQQDLINAALIEAHQPLRDLNAAYSAAYDPTAQYARVQSEAADQVDKVNTLLTDQANALAAQADAAVNAADVQLAENKAMEDYAKVMKDGKSTTDDVRDSAIALAKAHQATAAAQAEATGQTLTATQKLDSLNDGLLNTASTAKGPARQGILDYLFAVNQIPPDKQTDIRAAVAAGDLATATSLLNQASAPRTASMQADADNVAATTNDLNNVANPGGKPRIAKIQAQYIDSNGRVTNTPPLTGNPQSMPPAGIGVTPYAEVVNVTQYLPRGYHGDALGDARKAARRAGGAYMRNRR